MCTLLLVIALANPNCAALAEHLACRNAAEVYCDKVFQCAPLAAAGWYLSESNCVKTTTLWCDADETTGCDLNDAAISGCADFLNSKSCSELYTYFLSGGTWPCQAFYSCQSSS
jgi:hypothetical protein